jgi:hypothetical protein
MLPTSAARGPAHGRAPLRQVPEPRARARPAVPQGARAAAAPLPDDGHGEPVLAGPRAAPQPGAGLHAAGGGGPAAPAARYRLECTRRAALSQPSAPRAAATEAGPSHARSPQHNPTEPAGALCRLLPHSMAAPGRASAGAAVASEARGGIARWLASGTEQRPRPHGHSRHLALRWHARRSPQ